MEIEKLKKKLHKTKRFSKFYYYYYYYYKFIFNFYNFLFYFRKKFYDRSTKYGAIFYFKCTQINLKNSFPISKVPKKIQKFIFSAPQRILSFSKIKKNKKSSS